MHLRVLGLVGALCGLLLTFGLLGRATRRPARTPAVGSRPAAGDAKGQSPAEAPEPQTSPTEDGDEQREQEAAWVLFLLLDRDGDGFLGDDEMPPALRSQLRHWDADGNGAIDASEFLSYFEARVARARAEGPPAPGGVVPRWFAALDADGDGQIALSEWTAAGRPVEEFRLID